MKKVMFGAVACLGLVIGFESAANAQTLDGVKVTLPVEAKAGKVSLPAGTYSITELNNSVLEIKSEAKNGVRAFVTVMSVLTPDSHASAKTMVTLKKEGDAYQLDNIWIEGQDLGFELASAVE
jgi:polygalacturonase